MSDLSYHTSVAANGNIISFHPHIKAARHRLPQVTGRVLSCPTQLFCRIKGAPCLVKVHDRNIYNSHAEKHEQECLDEAEVGDNAETKTSHCIFAFLEVKVELRFIGIRLTVITKV